MLKLYNLATPDKRYWETWDNGDGSHTIHWGALGDRGETKTVIAGLFGGAEKKVQSEINSQVKKGFRPIDVDDHRVLLIEYEIDGFGSDSDLEKRHRLESRMNETLGWTGLGHCDGGSIGSGTMEACCFVVDFEIARALVEKDLDGTEFSNYKRIFDERANDA